MVGNDAYMCVLNIENAGMMGALLPGLYQKVLASERYVILLRKT